MALSTLIQQVILLLASSQRSGQDVSSKVLWMSTTLIFALAPDTSVLPSILELVAIAGPKTCLPNRKIHIIYMVLHVQYSASALSLYMVSTTLSQ